MSIARAARPREGPLAMSTRNRFNKKRAKTPLVLLLAAFATAAALAGVGCFGGEPIIVGGTAYTSLELEEKYFRAINDTNSERPRTDLGPLATAEVRLSAPSNPKLGQVITRTDVEGKFEAALPVPMLNKIDQVAVTFQFRGYKGETFLVPVSEIRAAKKAVGRKYFLEFWMPPSEPEL
jgi:hypothetical protein